MGALLIIPLVIAAGIAVDVGRLTACRQALQDSVDAAALAGATAFIEPSYAEQAKTAATNSLNDVDLPDGATLLTGFQVNTDPYGSTNFSGSQSYNVQVTASARLKLTILSLLPTFLNSSTGLSSIETVTVSATASRPVMVAQLSGGNVNSSSFRSSADDWNAIWFYTVPRQANGTPLWNYMPDIWAMTEIWSNCNAVVSSKYSGGSLCNQYAGHKAPARSGNAMLVAVANQPIGFALENLTGGLWNYGANQYGSQYGQTNWFFSTYEAQTATKPPSYGVNSSYQGQDGYFPGTSDGYAITNAALSLATVYSQPSPSYITPPTPVSNSSGSSGNCDPTQTTCSSSTTTTSNGLGSTTTSTNTTSYYMQNGMYCTSNGSSSATSSLNGSSSGGSGSSMSCSSTKPAGWGISTGSSTAQNTPPADTDSTATYGYPPSEQRQMDNAQQQPPSGYAQSGYDDPRLSSFYPTRSTTYPVNQNCSLIVTIQQANTPMPSTPPAGPPCYAPNDPSSGYRNVAPTCEQLAHNPNLGGKPAEYIYWWNDMGGRADDHDYNDAYYLLTCTPANSNGKPNGGSGSGNVEVVLTQ